MAIKKSLEDWAKTRKQPRKLQTGNTAVLLEHHAGICIRKREKAHKRYRSIVLYIDAHKCSQRAAADAFDVCINTVKRALAAYPLADG